MDILTIRPSAHCTSHTRRQPYLQKAFSHSNTAYVFCAMAGVAISNKAIAVRVFIFPSLKLKWWGRQLSPSVWCGIETPSLLRQPQQIHIAAKVLRRGERPEPEGGSLP
jgi:hypothetical protein